MKTSNKLLITLAVLLIIVPIIVIAVNVKLNYTDRKSYFKKYISSQKSFSTPLVGYESLKMNKFTSINIADANNIYLNIKVIKDSQFGLKIENELAGMFNFFVDKNGTLQIEVKNGKRNMPHATNLFIYAEKIPLINVAKAGGFYVDIDADSLVINAKDMDHLAFEPNAKLAALQINADKVKDIALSVAGIENVTTNLNSSGFRTVDASYSKLFITSSGDSNISIIGNKKNKKKYFIGKLEVNTLNNPSLTIEDVEVKNIATRLSDSTQISMQASYIKQSLIK